MHRIAFVGNYLPRQCGIATFTTDLCEGVASAYPEIECYALAINDQPGGYDYPERVRFELQQEDLKTYQSAADFLNLQEVDLVSLQHEFGIFGGNAGSHILTLLHGLQAPIVTTLHTVLKEPNRDQRMVMDELARLSDRLVVMSQRAQEFLQSIYHVPEDKIDLIPHGIPDVAFIDPDINKEKFKVTGKQVLATFGLLSPNKGIEYVIQALPAILAEHPQVVYLVLGKTHPHVQRFHGESYRQGLQCLAEELGVARNVVFLNQFASLGELVEFIAATDIYITPYLNETQIVSGTLAYTIGAGKAVISTPYWYAQELLADGRGRIVPFQDGGAIAEQVINLLDHESETLAMRKRAYEYGRKMVWPKVAEQYKECFVDTRRGYALRLAAADPAGSLRMPASLPDSKGWALEMPSLNLAHLLRLTDDTGMLQHAIHTLPNYREGYTTDDNARALVLSALLDRLDNEVYVDLQAMTSRYLAFLWYAFNSEKGRFRNFLSYSRSWLEEIGSDDSHGRALWGLGSALGRASNPGMMGVAARLFHLALPASLAFTSPRGWAFSLLGIHEYLRRFSGDRAVMRVGESLAQRLMNLYLAERGPNWCWFEDRVTYNNPSLPHALLLSSQWMDRADMRQAALEALGWLAEIQTGPQGLFEPVGCHGFYPRHGRKAEFDQQPVEAGAMVSACLEAYRMSADQSWLGEVQRAFGWFTGQNVAGQPVYDPVSGGCRDGIHPDRMNQNQGAESTLAFLLALAELKEGTDATKQIRIYTTVPPLPGEPDLDRRRLAL